jgi:hypothetical protein
MYLIVILTCSVVYIISGSISLTTLKSIIDHRTRVYYFEMPATLTYVILPGIISLLSFFIVALVFIHFLNNRKKRNSY